MHDAELQLGIVLRQEDWTVLFSFRFSAAAFCLLLLSTANRPLFTVLNL